VKIKIRAWDGKEFIDREVDALPTETPGLVIHRAVEGVGLVLSHVGTGLQAAVFPDDIFWCAQALGELGDWTTNPDRDLIARAWPVIDAYKAAPVPCIAPQDASAAEWAKAGLPVGAGDRIPDGGPAAPATADTIADHSRPSPGSVTADVAGTDAEPVPGRRA
jgi:hypothetical protein